MIVLLVDPTTDQHKYACIKKAEQVVLDRWYFLIDHNNAEVFYVHIDRIEQEQALSCRAETVDRIEHGRHIGKECQHDFVQIPDITEKNKHC